MQSGRWPWGSLGRGGDLQPSPALLGAAYIGNFVADALTTRACERQQLPEALVACIRAEDALGAKVRRRLAVIAGIEAQRRLAEGWPTGRNPRKGVKRWKGVALRHALLKQALRHGHTLTLGKLLASCQGCHSKTRLRAALAWTRVGCMGRSLPGVHASHRPRVYKGISFCMVCGAWAKVRAIKLSRACTGVPTPAGKAALRALGRQSLPPGLPRWPVD